MNTNNLTHTFVAGLFIAFVFMQSATLSFLFGMVLVTIYGNYILPIIMALFIDITFVDTRNISNIFGFMYTLITITLTTILMSLRKFLKL